MTDERNLFEILVSLDDENNVSVEHEQPSRRSCNWGNIYHGPNSSTITNVVTSTRSQIPTGMKPSKRSIQIKESFPDTSSDDHMQATSSSHSIKRSLNNKFLQQASPQSPSMTGNVPSTPIDDDIPILTLSKSSAEKKKQGQKSKEKP